MKIVIKIIITSIAILGIGLINLDGQDSVDSIQLFVAEAEEAVQKYMDENVFTRPNGLRENLKLPFRVGDLDLPERKKKVHQ